jgi:hypothetical protein
MSFSCRGDMQLSQGAGELKENSGLPWQGLQSVPESWLSPGRDTTLEISSWKKVWLARSFHELQMGLSDKCLSGRKVTYA